MVDGNLGRARSMVPRSFVVGQGCGWVDVYVL